MALSSTHFLSEDFCILNAQHFFVRCVLELPILGSGGQCLGFGVWSTLGWFSNRLKGYPDTFNLKCQVHPRAGRQRPWIELEPTEHPLAREQREGVTLDRVLELHALDGHDLARSLAD